MTQLEMELLSTGISNKVMFLLTKESKYRDVSCSAMVHLRQQGSIDEAMYREFVEDMNNANSNRH